MTPDQIAEIKERAYCPSAIQAVQHGEFERCARAIVERDAQALVAEIERLQAAVVAVREVHRLHGVVDRADATTVVCESCSVDYPCPTIRALDEHLGGGE